MSMFDNKNMSMFDNKNIMLLGLQGPQGEPGPQGEQGVPGVKITLDGSVLYIEEVE